MFNSLVENCLRCGASIKISSAPGMTFEGDLYCCYCRAYLEGACMRCWDLSLTKNPYQKVKTFEDPRCSTMLMVCADCLQQRCLHRSICERNGCITLEEFTQRVYEEEILMSANLDPS